MAQEENQAVKVAIDRLRLELTRAREEYEYRDKVWQNPHSGDTDWQNRCVAWGQWNGIAKAIESLIQLEKDLTSGG